MKLVSLIISIDQIILNRLTKRNLVSTVVYINEIYFKKTIGEIGQLDFVAICKPVNITS